MSGIDPLAAFASEALANAQAAIADAALNLGTLLEEFRAQISVGDVLTATVLSAENGVDRISVLGQTLPAQLPPGINPGEQIALQVTGFTNTAILVRNLGTLDPAQPVPQAHDVPPLTQGDAQSAVLSVKTPAVQAPAGQAPAGQAPARQAPVQQAPVQQAPVQPVAPQRGPQPPVAPPRELFVAASVQTPGAKAQDVAPIPQSDLEARIAASRATPLPAPDAPISLAKPTPAQQASVAAQSKPPLTELLAKTLTPPILVRRSL